MIPPPNRSQSDSQTQRTDQPERSPTSGTWVAKFGHAFRGVFCGVRGQNSFVVHLSCTAAVVLAGLALSVQWWEWCVLTLAITGVLTAELLNSALEQLAKAITDRYDPYVRDALDISSAAVLAASAGSVVLGLLVFLPRICVLVISWIN